MLLPLSSCPLLKTEHFPSTNLGPQDPNHAQPFGVPWFPPRATSSYPRPSSQPRKCRDDCTLQVSNKPMQQPRLPPETHKTNSSTSLLPCARSFTQTETLLPATINSPNPSPSTTTRPGHHPNKSVHTSPACSLPTSILLLAHSHPFVISTASPSPPPHAGCPRRVNPTQCAASK